jgi:hypothetical protein
MPNNRTPGQIAYEAWWMAFGDEPPLADAYAGLTPRAQQSWDAAAQAVLAPRLTDQAEKMHHLLAYLLDHATPEDLDTLHGWLTEQTARLHQKKRR